MPKVHVEPLELSVNVTSPVLVTCYGQGEPRPNVSWESGERNGTASWLNYSTSSLVAVTLNIEATQTEDSGVILCAAENMVGRTEAGFTLNVFCESLTFSLSHERFL